MCGGVWIRKDKSNGNLLRPNGEMRARPLLLSTPTRRKLKGQGCHFQLTIAMETASQCQQLVARDVGSKAGFRSHQQGGRTKDLLALRSALVGFLKHFVPVRSGQGQDCDARVCSRFSRIRQGGEVNRNLSLVIPNILALSVYPTCLFHVGDVIVVNQKPKDGPLPVKMGQRSGTSGIGNGFIM